MKRFDLSAVFGLACALLLSAGLQAHTELARSVPADGTLVEASPEALELVFNADVRLLRVSVTRHDDRAVDIGFTPKAEAASRFAVPLPVLEEGGYTVAWTILGSDSHRVEGGFSFSVGMAAAPPAANSAGHQGNH